MTVADGILKAAQRWLRLLNRSTFSHASLFIRTDPQYTDLSATQYASAFEWLIANELLHKDDDGVTLTFGNQGMPTALIDEQLFTHTLRGLDPPWLVDADLLVPDATELPQDAVDIAETLGLPETRAWIATRQLQGKIDLAARSHVGALGETCLVELLEQYQPGSTVHLALENDGYGYDILHSANGAEWHIEVKTTNRRGRLTIYISRNEFEVALRDPNWRLVIVGLDTEGRACSIATARHDVLSSRAPVDRNGSNAHWESARYQLQPIDLIRGLPFLRSLSSASRNSWAISKGSLNRDDHHAWMPDWM